MTGRVNPLIAAQHSYGGDSPADFEASRQRLQAHCDRLNGFDRGPAYSLTGKWIVVGKDATMTCAFLG